MWQVTVFCSGCAEESEVYSDGRRVWFVEGERVREERSAPQPSPAKAR